MRGSHGKLAATQDCFSDGLVLHRLLGGGDLELFSQVEHFVRHVSDFADVVLLGDVIPCGVEDNFLEVERAVFGDGNAGGQVGDLVAKQLGSLAFQIELVMQVLQLLLVVLWHLPFTIGVGRMAALATAG